MITFPYEWPPPPQPPNGYTEAWVLEDTTGARRQMVNKWTTWSAKVLQWAENMVKRGIAPEQLLNPDGKPFVDSEEGWVVANLRNWINSGELVQGDPKNLTAANSSYKLPDGRVIPFNAVPSGGGRTGTTATTSTSGGLTSLLGTGGLSNVDPMWSPQGQEYLRLMNAAQAELIPQSRLDTLQQADAAQRFRQEYGESLGKYDYMNDFWGSVLGVDFPKENYTEPEYRDYLNRALYARTPGSGLSGGSGSPDNAPVYTGGPSNPSPSVPGDPGPLNPPVQLPELQTQTEPASVSAQSTTATRPVPPNPWGFTSWQQFTTPDQANWASNYLLESGAWKDWNIDLSDPTKVPEVTPEMINDINNTLPEGYQNWTGDQFNDWLKQNYPALQTGENSWDPENGTYTGSNSYFGPGGWANYLATGGGLSTQPTFMEVPPLPQSAGYQTYDTATNPMKADTWGLLAPQMQELASSRDQAVAQIRRSLPAGPARERAIADAIKASYAQAGASKLNLVGQALDYFNALAQQQRFQTPVATPMGAAESMLASSASMRGQDIGLAGTKYSADIGLQGTKYASDIGLQGTKYAADKSAQAQNKGGLMGLLGTLGSAAATRFGM